MERGFTTGPFWLVNMSVFQAAFLLSGIGLYKRKPLKTRQICHSKAHLQKSFHTGPGQLFCTPNCLCITLSFSGVSRRSALSQHEQQFANAPDPRPFQIKPCTRFPASGWAAILAPPPTATSQQSGSRGDSHKGSAVKVRARKHIPMLGAEIWFSLDERRRI